MQEGYIGLSTKFVNQFAFPEEHNMPLSFNCFLLYNIKSFEVKSQLLQVSRLQQLLDVMYQSAYNKKSFFSFSELLFQKDSILH